MIRPIRASRRTARNTRRLLATSVLGLALVGAGVAAAASPTAGRHYAGKTRQGRKISFSVSSSGKRITHPRLYLITTCPGAVKSFASTSAHNTATATGSVDSGGAFTLRFKETAQFTHGIYTSAVARFSVSGHFTSAKRATGKASVTVSYAPGTFKCTALGVRFTVTRT
jgi:hypothetical protein